MLQFVIELQCMLGSQCTYREMDVILVEPVESVLRAGAQTVVLIVFTEQDVRVNEIGH